MKHWIKLLVIAVHIGIVLLIVGPCKHPGCRSAPGSGAANTAPEIGDSGGGGAVDPSRDTGQTVAALKSGRGGQSGGNVYSDDFFTRTIVALPPALKADQEGCRTGIVVDWTHRRVLWAKAESKVVPVASLTKMMTTLLLMEAIREDPDLALDTKVKVTRAAAAVGGRQVWLDPRETFSVEDLLRCMLIHSANDAAFLVGQKIAGSEKEFVGRMNQRAGTLRLRSFVFHNAHGLPEGPSRKENMGCAIELAYLAGRLLAYDDALEWSSTRLSYLQPRIDGSKTQLLNTNKLVGRVPGVNGMKTGYTSKSGYCLALTCDRGERQIIVVVTGCARGSERDNLVTALVEWAYSRP